MRIKALPLSQSKEEKRTEGVITIQRGKDSWNQRPQTSGSSTPPLTCAPHMHARLHAHYHPPTPPLQRTHRRHHRRQHCPPPPSHLLPRVTCSLTTTPHPCIPLAYKIFPTSSLNPHIAQSKNTPDKNPSAK
jgi:hypothetical protein